MAILEIELQPAEQARLEQEAQREGLSVQDWVRRRLAGDQPARSLAEIIQAIHEADDNPAVKPIWEIAAEIGSEIPSEEKARLPRDGSINYKHYLYGAPKRDVPEDLQ